ncbi:unnamed protein product, partial [marine sediment metagenome]
MAKPKSPLLSLGARGSIGDTLTFQRRGRLTIARQKPIPTDPQTDLQLAQRQVYREAVAAWNALTIEEKEAYRGVCPGLTPYQCFMKSELLKPAPVPPPEEKIEEQLEHNLDWNMYAPTYYQVGQRLFIADRIVTKLAFPMSKYGSPEGDITFEIRRISDDGVIVSKLWGLAENLPAPLTWQEVEFDTPPTINEEVRIGVYFMGGTSQDLVQLRYIDTD